MIHIADAYHHAMSSVKKWGGTVEDYLPLHRWFDETKTHFSDPRHRAIRHHSQGIGWLQDTFGMAISLSTCAVCGNAEDHERHAIDPGAYDGLSVKGPNYHHFRAKTVPTRWIGEQHVQEDFGRIPTMADFLRLMSVEPWMVRGARKLSRELEKDDLTTGVEVACTAEGVASKLPRL